MNSGKEIQKKANIGFTFLNTLPVRMIEFISILGIIVAVLIRIGMGIDAQNYRPGPQGDKWCDDLGNKNLFFNKIELKHVKWRYEKGEKDVLTDLNFTIHKGEIIGMHWKRHH